MLEDFYNLILDSVVGLIEAIPVPAWAQNVTMEVPPYVAWGLGLFEVGTGASIIMGAYVVRFLIRRIPFIG